MIMDSVVLSQETNTGQEQSSSSVDFWSENQKHRANSTKFNIEPPPAQIKEQDRAKAAKNRKIASRQTHKKGVVSEYTPNLQASESLVQSCNSSGIVETDKFEQASSEVNLPKQ